MNYLTKYPILLLLLAIGRLSLIAQPAKKDYVSKVETFYKETLELFDGVPGVGLAIVSNKETLYAGGFGYADLEQKLPFAADTEFYIASCTKSFTGLLAAILDKEGVIKLDAPVTKYLKEIAFDPALEMDKVKIRDLLTHTSGLEHQSIGFRLAYTGQHTHELLMGQLKDLKANESGRGTYQYTNLGYNIYTLISEELTGKPWQKLLEEKVFKPLGMDRTTAYMSRVEKNNWTFAKPYFAMTKAETEEVYLRKRDNTMQSAGGLVITPQDAATWMKMQLNMGKLKGQQVYPKDLIAMTRNPMANAERERGGFTTKGYGLGWMTGTARDKELVWHTGGFPGSFSLISFAPEANFGVAVFVNEALAGHRLMYLLANYAYDAYWQPEGWEADYEQQRTDLHEYLKTVAKNIRADLAERAKRTWNLTESFEDYSGIFENEVLGTIEIIGNEEQIEVKMGNLHCVATPFPKKNTIRVELVPGSGEVIQFIMEDGRIAAFETDGDVFRKVN